MIRPPRFRPSAGPRVGSRRTPFTFTLMSCSYWSAVTSRNSSARKRPALLTSYVDAAELLESFVDAERRRRLEIVDAGDVARRTSPSPGFVGNQFVSRRSVFAWLFRARRRRRCRPRGRRTSARSIVRIPLDSPVTTAVCSASRSVMPSGSTSNYLLLLCLQLVY